MRSAVACLQMSMHAMAASAASAMAVAASVTGAPAAASTATQVSKSSGSSNSSSGTGSMHQRLAPAASAGWAAHAQRPLRQQRHALGMPSACSAAGWLHSDRARQRRLVAAAPAAQPALAEVEVEQQGSGAGWLGLVQPAMGEALAAEPFGLLTPPPQQTGTRQSAGPHLPRRRGRPPKKASLAAQDPAGALPPSATFRSGQLQQEHAAAFGKAAATAARAATEAAVAASSAQQQQPQTQQPQAELIQQPLQPLQAQPAHFRLPVPNLGYTCLNVQLQQQHGVRTNRSCRRRTFEAEGLPLVSQLALQNCQDLLPIVEWNRQHGIHFFRVPSALFPWSHEYELEELPDYEEIAATLAVVGAAARLAGQRLTAHPSHFVQLASPHEPLVARSLQHLELNARMFDLMGFAPSFENKINIHIGGLYGDKEAALGRFAAALDRLSPSCRARLTVENDDRPRWFSIADLLPLHAMAGVPLVFDFLHQALLPGGMSEEEALCAALDTWPTGVRPVVHYSEPSENPALARRAHSYMLTQPFSLYGREADVDVMLEAKGMEQALLFYRDELLLGRKTETRLKPR